MTLAEVYPWLKALHLVSVISWMAGLLYLPRLFVYHADAASDSEAFRTYTVMERRLLRIIMMPAMIGSFLFGALMLAAVDWAAGWLWIKFCMIAVLVFLHWRMSVWHREFAAGRNLRSARFYRIVNEVPTVTMIVIVIMAVVKPF